MTIVMVGVGAMGSALAARLIERGHDVLGVDPFLAAPGEQARSADGVVVVHSLDEVSQRGVRPSELLIFVRMADQVVEVLTTADADTTFDGVPATVLSTLSPADARDIAARFSGRRPVSEAPVSGGVAGARSGELTVLLAGFRGRWLDDAAARVFTFGGPGLPAAAKLLNNALAAANAHALTAALGQAPALDLDPAQMLEVIQVSSGGGWIAEHFHDFPVDLLWKDFHLLEQSAPVSFPSTDGGVDLPAVVLAARTRTTPRQ